MMYAYKPKVRIVWYKPNDLRIHDHEPLRQAHLDAAAGNDNGKDRVIHVLLLDPKLGFGPSAPLSRNANLPRIGMVRARFLLESIKDLEQRLREQNQIFWLYIDDTVQVFRTLQSLFDIQAVYAHGPEFCTEEQVIERKMKQFFKNKIPFKCFWGWTLHHPDDVAKIANLEPQRNKSKHSRQRNNAKEHINNDRGSSPRKYCVSERYKDFLHQVCNTKTRQSKCARGPLPNLLPRQWIKPSKLELDSMLSQLQEMSNPFDITALSVECIVRPEVNTMEFGDTIDIPKGGETAALQCMDAYIWKEDRIQNYVGSSDSMTPGHHNALNSTTGLSAYLAHGCLSPRLLYANVQTYERRRTKNRSTYWVFHEMVFRDFFVFQCLQAWKSALYHLKGPIQHDDGGKNHKWRNMNSPKARKLFDLWKEGRTGYPMVDAGMRQLHQTGHMPHLVRQIAAGFLVRDLKLDWRWGAEWFEHCLQDYTPDANYGNWAYRILPLQQLLPLEEAHLTSLELISWPVVHDPKLEYTLEWVPELRSIASSEACTAIQVREPWRMDCAYERKASINVKPCKDSPLWIMSVNRSNWPEYQKIMTGSAWTLAWDTNRIGGCINSSCNYAYPIVAPLELEIQYDKIPLDHSWGVGKLATKQRKNEMETIQSRKNPIINKQENKASKKQAANTTDAKKNLTNPKQKAKSNTGFANPSFHPLLKQAMNEARGKRRKWNPIEALKSSTGMSATKILGTLDLTAKHCGAYYLSGKCKGNRNGRPCRFIMEPIQLEDEKVQRLIDSMRKDNNDAKNAE